MGKIRPEKKFKAINRSAGAFHPLEVLEAKNSLESDKFRGGKIVVEANKFDRDANPLTKGQRRRLAKKLQISKKSEIILKSEAKQIKVQEGTLHDLSTLKSSLPEPSLKSSSNQTARNVKMTRNNRKRIAISEIAQFQAVLAHPAFQANPLATIQEHLENSLKAAIQR